MSKKLTKQPASYLKLAEVSKADILQAQYEPSKLSLQNSLPWFGKLFAMADASSFASSHCFAHWCVRSQSQSFNIAICHSSGCWCSSRTLSATSSGLSGMERILQESFSHFARNREIGPLASKFLHSERSVWWRGFPNGYGSTKGCLCWKEKALEH